MRAELQRREVLTQSGISSRQAAHPRQAGGLKRCREQVRNVEKVIDT